MSRCCEPRCWPRQVGPAVGSPTSCRNPCAGFRQFHGPATFPKATLNVRRRFGKVHWSRNMMNECEMPASDIRSDPVGSWLRLAQVHARSIITLLTSSNEPHCSALQRACKRFGRHASYRDFLANPGLAVGLCFRNWGLRCRTTLRLTLSISEVNPTWGQAIRATGQPSGCQD